MIVSFKKNNGNETSYDILSEEIVKNYCEELSNDNPDKIKLSKFLEDYKKAKDLHLKLMLKTSDLNFNTIKSYKTFNNKNKKLYGPVKLTQSSYDFDKLLISPINLSEQKVDNNLFTMSNYDYLDESLNDEILKNNERLYKLQKIKNNYDNLLFAIIEKIKSKNNISLKSKEIDFSKVEKNNNNCKSVTKLIICFLFFVIVTFSIIYLFLYLEIISSSLLNGLK